MHSPVIRPGDAGDILEVLEFDGVEGESVFDLPDIVSTGVCAGEIEAEGVQDEDTVWGEGDGCSDFCCKVGFFKYLFFSSVTRLGWVRII